MSLAHQDQYAFKARWGETSYKSKPRKSLVQNLENQLFSFKPTNAADRDERLKNFLV